MVCYWAGMETFWLSLGVGAVLSVAMGIGEARRRSHWVQWAIEDARILAEREAKAARWRVKRNAFLKRQWLRLTGRGSQLVRANSQGGWNEVVGETRHIPVSRTEILP